MMRTREQRHRDRNKNSPDMQMQSFWCDSCRVDYSGFGFKCRIPSTIPEYVYRSRHRTCGKVNVRRITDLHLDPYFNRSRKLWRERNKNAVDTLQRWSPGFRAYYGDMLDAEDDSEYEKEQELIKKNNDPSLRLLTK